jgi:hypothetical protein
MPEASPETQPQPIPPAQPNKPNDPKFYVVCAVALALLATCYAYVTKYKETKSVLDLKETSLTTATENYHALEEKFSSYKSQMQSKTSFIKKPYMFNGSLVLDGHGNATYVKIYLKDKTLISVGNSTSFNELSKTVTVTQAVTVTEHKVDNTVSGSKTNGMFYVSAPVEVVIGSLARVGAGFNHNFIFGTALGVEAGTIDIKNPIGGRYINMHLGFQTP